ncbi:hypothetical protein [Streptomyces zaomyceticus]|uniref:hypothetical protein n=1 Tax=Streptomyces zaomyceticus TaxID=68286 RepID=UPI003448152C
MSAREELVSHIVGLGHSICIERCGNCTCAETDEAEANALIDALLREHAQGLAERIRLAYEGNGPDEDNWIRTPFDASSLIDPDEIERRRAEWSDGKEVTE